MAWRQAPRAVAITLLIVVTLVVAVAPHAQGQAFVEPVDATLRLDASEQGTVNFTLKNPVNRSLAGFAAVDGPLAEGASAVPREFKVASGAQRQLTVLVDASRFEQGEHRGTLRIQLVDRETGATQRLSANLTVSVPAPLMLFHLYDVEPPGVLDSPLGFFLMEAVAWVLVGFVGMQLGDVVSRRFMRHVPKWLKDQAVARLHTPVFLLILGAGIADAWRFFPAEGLYAVGNALLTTALVVLSAFLAYRLVDVTLISYGRRVAPRTESKWDDVVVPVLRKVTVAVIFSAAVIYVFQGFGLDLSVLVAGGLVIGLVLSASLGPTLTNLFAGLFIMMDRPFKEGDDIRLDTGEVCNVRRIGLRSTRLYFYRNHEYFIAPNAQLESNRIVNLMHPDARYKMHVEVGVAYGSDVQLVTETLTEVADGHDDVLSDEDSRPMVLFDGFGDSALLFRLIVFVDEVRERFRIASELRYAIDARFRERGITIPFPQRTLWFHDESRGDGAGLPEAGSDEAPAPPSNAGGPPAP